MHEVEPKHIDHLVFHESGVEIISGHWTVMIPKSVALRYAKDWADLGAQGFVQTRRSYTLVHGDARLILFDAEAIMLRDAIQQNFAADTQPSSWSQR